MRFAIAFFLIGSVGLGQEIDDDFHAMLVRRCLCEEFGGECICEAGQCPCENCPKHKAKAKTIPRRAVLYFTADWCAPCKTWQTTELPKLAKADVSMGDTKHDEFRVFTAEIHPKMIRDWNIQAFPTFIFLDDVTEDSYVVKRRVAGSVSAAEIHRWLN